mmetsp:Transcript_47653/g.77278  ORF Transcript_47653/g.77278 Transcript_47653/m.77278 type:complete len:203 (+) Transcript_47653:787-1395(+)
MHHTGRVWLRPFARGRSLGRLGVTSGRHHVAVHRVERPEQGLGELGTHLSAVEAVMSEVSRCVLPLEAAAELAERSRSIDARVCGLEGVVDNKSSIVDKTVPVNGVEDVWVNIHGVRSDANAAGQDLLRQACGARAKVLHGAVWRLAGSLTGCPRLLAVLFCSLRDFPSNWLPVVVVLENQRFEALPIALLDTEQPVALKHL